MCFFHLGTQSGLHRISILHCAWMYSGVVSCAFRLIDTIVKKRLHLYLAVKESIYNTMKVETYSPVPYWLTTQECNSSQAALGGSAEEGDVCQGMFVKGTGLVTSLQASALAIASNGPER